jgi:acetolactate synthase I/II/III large subunit
MIVATEIADTLYRSGIRRAYGLPGEDHMTLLAEFEAAGIEYCAAYNESSAVIMAATEAQLTGLPGVAVLSLAPGVSNGLNGLLNTYLDQVPLLLLSGQHATRQLPLVVRQGFDIEHLVSPMTKWRARITVGMRTASVVGKALDIAMSSNPGPVYLEIPDDVATAESITSQSEVTHVAAALRRQWNDNLQDRRAPEPSVLARLANRLTSASRPALVIGGRRRRVSPATVAAFAEKFRIPVFTTIRQKGTLTQDSTFFAGTFLNGKLERSLLADCDLVLLVDPDPFDFYNKPWNFDCDAIALTEDQFSEWLNPFAERYSTQAEAMLSALAQWTGVTRSVWTEEQVKEYRTQLRSALLGPGGDGMSVARAVDTALSVLPPNGYLVADAGFSKPLVAMLSESAVPDQFLASNCLSTMGYAIPAAVAASRAGAGPILAFLGDGSLLMRATELMVSPQTGAHTAFVAIMDRCLTQIAVKQDRRSLSRVGVSLPPVSCAQLGTALGIRGFDAAHPAELATAVRAGMDGGGPVLVGALVDSSSSPKLFDMLRG